MSLDTLSGDWQRTQTATSAARKLRRRGPWPLQDSGAAQIWAPVVTALLPAQYYLKSRSSYTTQRREGKTLHVRGCRATLGSAKSCQTVVATFRGRPNPAATARSATRRNIIAAMLRRKERFFTRSQQRQETARRRPVNLPTVRPAQQQLHNRQHRPGNDQSTANEGFCRPPAPSCWTAPPRRRP